MTLRTKLFLLLAAVALVPLIALGLLEYEETAHLAAQLGEANRNAIVADLTRLLNRTARSTSAYLDELADACRLGVDLQAAVVEQALARGEGLHAARVRAGARALYNDHNGLFLNVFTGLENGDFVVFPERRMPEGYDPRVRAWYRGARTAGTAVWSVPFVSASTGEPTIAVSKRVFASDGRFAGVTAIEFALIDLLRRIDSTTFDYATSSAGALARFSDSVQSLFVVPERGERGTPERLGILAERAYGTSDADWHVAPRIVALDAAPGPGYRAVVADVAAGRAGFAHLTFRGHDSLWAYAPIAPLRAALLVVLRDDRVLAAADTESAVVRARAAAEVRNMLVTAAAMVVLVGVLALIVSGVATRSIRALVAVTVRIGAGDLRTRAEVRGRDEIATLADAINAMVPKLQGELQMRSAIELAGAVQQNLLPREPPRIAGFDVAGASVYCDEMGGDYYDILDLSHDGRRRVGVVVGDVSGHGIAAAFLMAGARAALRASIDAGGDWAAAMRRTNALLCADANDGNFMTLMLLVLDDDGALRWVNAGHEPPVAYRPGEDRFIALDGSDVPLGIEPDWPYTERTAELPPGETVIVLGTDGLWEAPDAAGVPLGRERYRELIRRHAGKPAVELARAVVGEVLRLRGGAPAEDDLTLVVVKRTLSPAGVPVTEGTASTPA